MYINKKDECEVCMKIGFFDSGVGGLTVLHQARKEMPYADFIYFADFENAPYGEKPKQEVRRLVFDAVDYLAQQKVDAVVIACNTATSAAIEELRKVYPFPILGMEPAIKPALASIAGQNKHVLVLATSLTLREEKFHQLVDKLNASAIVDTIPLGGLVQFAEQSDFSSPAIMEYLRNQFKGINKNEYGAVVLGCTHFPLYIDFIKTFFLPGTQFFDGIDGTIHYLQTILKHKIKAEGQQGQTRFVVTGGKEWDGILFRAVLDLLSKNQESKPYY